MKYKKILIISLIVIAIFISVFIIYQYADTKYYTGGSCGGVVGSVCSEGYYCKGATQQNEGSGTCTKR